MPDDVEIYALCEPDTWEPRYIGKANDAMRRYASHMRDARRRDTPVYRWIRARVGRGTPPAMLVLTRCHASRWQAEEIAQIAAARDAGARLLNVAAGGDEPHCPANVRAENGRRVAASRPRSVMLAYRVMESNVRFLSSISPDKGDLARVSLDRFRHAVQAHRIAGTMAQLDAALAVMFAGKGRGV
jgi:hypothetical protein